jgi:magnesium transporter
MLYPPEIAGGLMSARVETFRPDATAGEILDDLRTRPGGQVLDVVLVDPSAQVVGLVAIEDLATAGSSTPASDLVRRSPPSVDAMASRDEVLETLDQSKARTLPVVDAAGRLLGVLRQDALVRAVEAEFSVDMQTMVGASKEEQALSPVMFAVRKRLPWLQINLVTAFLAAAVVGLFEETIAQVTALAVLLPVVAGQSGNTGAQALAVTMRGLALREIRLRHWRQVSIKEATVGFLNGIGVSLTTSIGVYVWSRSATLSLVIGSSMLLSMVTAGLAGAVVPLMLTALRQDPAGSSSIVLTTVTDIVGFFSFLGIATLLMSSL